MFDSPFFKKFPQQWSSFISDDGEEMKYEFPTFYDGSRGMMGIFGCSFGKAKSLLPAGSLAPVPSGIGRAVVVVAAFEYLNPKGMAPYNEILFGIPCVGLKPGSALPMSGFSVQQLIVDVPENIQRGKHVWGMNKSMGEFKFFDEGNMRVCEVFRNNRRALRFEVVRKGRSRTFEECRTLLTEKDGRLLGSRSCASGRRVDTRAGASLILGADPFCAELESLDIADLPIKASFISNYAAAVSLPSESAAI